MGGDFARARSGNEFRAMSSSSLPPSRQFTRQPPLDIGDLDPNPLDQLQRWLDDAVAHQMLEPTAMTLATVDARGRPSARIVLFKGFVDGGLTFYTNYDSRKGQELAERPDAALVFWWDQLERSVRIEGRVHKLPHELSTRYFHRRMRESQVGAWVSRQSRVVASREELDRRFDTAMEKFASEAEIPLPPFWGGYRVEPESIEFWQGRLGRLHDRLRYRRENDGWLLERLEP